MEKFKQKVKSDRKIQEQMKKIAGENKFQGRGGSGSYSDRDNRGSRGYRNRTNSRDEDRKEARFQSRRQSERFYWILMNGLPFSATDEDVKKFLLPFKPDAVVLIKDADGRPSGRAYAKFKDRTEAVYAIERKHRQNMDDRYILLSRSNAENLFREKQREGKPKAPDPSSTDPLALSLSKTMMCKFWKPEVGKTCHRGIGCTYAHGEEELAEGRKKAALIHQKAHLFKAGATKSTAQGIAAATAGYQPVNAKSVGLPPPPPGMILVRTPIVRPIRTTSTSSATSTTPSVKTDNVSTPDSKIDSLATAGHSALPTPGSQNVFNSFSGTPTSFDYSQAPDTSTTYNNRSGSQDVFNNRSGYGDNYSSTQQTEVPPTPSTNYTQDLAPDSGYPQDSYPDSNFTQDVQPTPGYSEHLPHSSSQTASSDYKVNYNSDYNSIPQADDPLSPLQPSTYAARASPTANSVAPSQDYTYSKSNSLQPEEQLETQTNYTSYPPQHQQIEMPVSQVQQVQNNYPQRQGPTPIKQEAFWDPILDDWVYPPTSVDPSPLFTPGTRSSPVVSTNLRTGMSNAASSSASWTGDQQQSYDYSQYNLPPH